MHIRPLTPWILGALSFSLALLFERMFSLTTGLMWAAYGWYGSTSLVFFVGGWLGRKWLDAETSVVPLTAAAALFGAVQAVLSWASGDVVPLAAVFIGGTGTVTALLSAVVPLALFGLRPR